MYMFLVCVDVNIIQLPFPNLDKLANGETPEDVKIYVIIIHGKDGRGDQKKGQSNPLKKPMGTYHRLFVLR